MRPAPESLSSRPRPSVLLKTSSRKGTQPAGACLTPLDPHGECMTRRTIARPRRRFLRTATFACSLAAAAVATTPLAAQMVDGTERTSSAPAELLNAPTPQATPQTTTAPAPAAAKLQPGFLGSPIATGTIQRTEPISVSFLSRNRADALNYFDDGTYTSTYPYVEHLLRIALAQRIGHFDWLAELAENTVFDVPNTSVDPVASRGQLFFGGTYYASNGPANTTPSAASFKQGWLRYHGKGPDTTVRLGRFEFFDGQETTPKDSTLLWLQTNRIAQRLVGNFGFSNGQRSFDGADAHFGKGTFDVTAMAGRADQGVFNMNANPELNVDIQYLAFTKRPFSDHLIFRAFGLGYHDGRTGLTKTDNRTAAARALDHKNIRIGTYGGDAIASIPAGPGNFDALFWGVLQNGQWGFLNQHSGAFAVEAGYRFTKVASKPWIRGGDFRSTGDNNNTDTQHSTFFAPLPTPRVYARFPFYNSMNNKDQYVQLIDNPSKRWELRSDMHFLQLTSNTDFLYNGGGAYDNKVFGVTGRTANLHNSLASVFDISSDYALSPSLSLNTYYAHAYGRTVIASLYPGKQANFGYLELIYKFGIKQTPARTAK